MRFSTHILTISCLIAVPAFGQKSAPAPKNALSSLSESVEALSRRVSPAVVQIFSTGYALADEDEQGAATTAGLVTRQRSSGSGVVMSSDGYIVTNNHVVQNARRVRVQLAASETGQDPLHPSSPQRGRLFEARVVGADRESDLAVLKVESSAPLPTLKLADSEALRQGEIVLAFGNPLGLENSLSLGVVSSVGRQVKPDDPMTYIQTDAPINPGNSGGALLDAKGRVVGINTAILSHSGGSNGVGFAIPINLVRSVAEQLVSTGKVERGFLGVNLEPLTPDLAAQFGTGTGALVTDVTPGKPADKAGLKSGDIITTLNGKVVENPNHLQLAVISLPPGTEVTIGYLRDGKEATVNVKLDVRPASNDVASASNDEGVLNGVAVADITDEVREQLQLPPDLKGAVISEVDPESGSAQAGLTQGDIILELDRRRVHNADEAVKLSDEIKGPKVLVRIWRKGFSQYVVVDETKKSPATPPSNPPDEENQ